MSASIVSTRNGFNNYPPFNGYDEIDNKTGGLTLHFKGCYNIMTEKYNIEEERLKSFDKWPIGWLDKRELAQTGLYYIGENDEDDRVKCYFCEVEIGKWDRGDQPLSEHLRFSPHCPLLRRRTTNNVPLNAEALNDVLPPHSYDVCGNEGYEENAEQVRAVSEGLIPDELLASSQIAPSSDCQTYRHEFPEYSIELARERSFADWPLHMKQKPQEMAEAGFFYTGVGDRVKCFSCGGGLKDWNDSDEPWEQHALWLSNCQYLKLMKGQSYIDSQLAKRNPSGNCDTKPTANTAEPAFKDTAEKPAQTSITEDKLCKICYATEYNTAFLPCGHVVACAKCASSVDKCPLCRKPFTNVMRVYFS